MLIRFCDRKILFSSLIINNEWCIMRIKVPGAGQLALSLFTIQDIRIVRVIQSFFARRLYRPLFLECCISSNLCANS